MFKEIGKISLTTGVLWLKKFETILGEPSVFFFKEMKEFWEMLERILDAPLVFFFIWKNLLSSLLLAFERM